jgi:hypothetical protein
MTESNKKHESRRPDYVAEKESPNYRAKNTPRAEQTRECHTVKPKAAPASAAENTDEANQKCETTPEKPPQTASKDQHEKATG